MTTSNYWKMALRKWQSSGYGDVSNIKARISLRKQNIGYGKKMSMKVEKSGKLYNVYYRII